jgi:hypothetical protein
MKDSTQGKKSGLRASIKNGISMPIAHKLVLSFILVSVLSTAIFTYAGIRLMANRIVAETQDRIRNDLNAAREIYTGELAISTM